MEMGWKAAQKESGPRHIIKLFGPTRCGLITVPSSTVSHTSVSHTLGPPCSPPLVVARPGPPPLGWRPILYVESVAHAVAPRTGSSELRACNDAGVNRTDAAAPSRRRERDAARRAREPPRPSRLEGARRDSVDVDCGCGLEILLPPCGGERPPVGLSTRALRGRDDTSVGQRRACGASTGA